MKILLDECLPVKFKSEFIEFSVFTVKDMGWQGIKNGELLKKTVENDFDIFITSDKKLIYQINKNDLKISIIILDSIKNDLTSLRELTINIKNALSEIKNYEIITVNKFSIIK